MIEVKLPDIGEGIAEGEIIKWNVQPGDRVEADQPLVDILTDKAQVEIPSPVAGVVDKLLFAEGDLAPVGQVIVHLRSGDAAATEAPPVPAQVDAQPVTAQEAQAAPASEAAPAANVPAANPLPAASADVMATPAMRRQARSQGVDLNQVAGSGPYGRILSEDIAKAAAAGAPAPVTPPAVSAPGPQKAAAKPATAAADSDSEERIPLRGIRRKIAEQMVKAKFTAPDFLFVDEADVSELVAFRKEMAPELKAEGLKLTYLPFVVKAVVSALKAYPTLNASLDDERQEIVLKKHYHIGIATSSPNGLFVPVIRHADRKSVLELAVEIERLAAAVREGKASADEMRGSTFTITNIGAIGGLISAPIINHPEVAIMGLNKIYQKPMVYRDEIAIRWACNLSLSFDHRVVDGSDGAYFTRHIIRLLENPRRLLLET